MYLHTLNFNNMFNLLLSISTLLIDNNAYVWFVVHIIFILTYLEIGLIKNERLIQTKQHFKATSIFCLKLNANDLC